MNSFATCSTMHTIFGITSGRDIILAHGPNAHLLEYTCTPILFSHFIVGIRVLTKPGFHTQCKQTLNNHDTARFGALTPCSAVLLLLHARCPGDPPPPR
eukprot:COSAG02_NODE_468_length_21758_cov_41.206796_2_plen_99_part_00